MEWEVGCKTFQCNVFHKSLLIGSHFITIAEGFYLEGVVLSSVIFCRKNILSLLQQSLHNYISLTISLSCFGSKTS